MACEMCHQEDQGVLYLLPLRQPDGSLCVLACEDCAHNSRAYCPTHHRIHQGFWDGSTACIPCVEEIVNEKRDQAHEFVAELRAGLSKEAFERLWEKAEISSALTGDPPEVSILRFIVCKSRRSILEIEKIMSLTTNDCVETLFI